MKFFIIALIISIQVFAQDPRQSIHSLLAAIQYQVSQNQNPQILMAVEQQLQNTLATLQGYSNPAPNSSLTCVAKDNDGRDPWVLGFRDPSLLTVTKLPNSNLGSMDNCQQAKNNYAQINLALFVCVSKDNDGRAPFALAYYQNSKLVSTSNMGSNLGDCISSMQNSKRSMEAFAFCTSKDNDGRSPYTLKVVNVVSGNISTQGSYSNINDCFFAKKK